MIKQGNGTRTCSCLGQASGYQIGLDEEWNRLDLLDQDDRRISSINYICGMDLPVHDRRPGSSTICQALVDTNTRPPPDSESSSGGSDIQGRDGDDEGPDPDKTGEPKKQGPTAPAPGTTTWMRPLTRPTTPRYPRHETASPAPVTMMAKHHLRPTTPETKHGRP